MAHRTTARLLACVVVLAGAALPVGPGGSTAANAVPAEFEDTLVTNVSGPTEVAWTPDGRMLITGKGGLLRIYSGGRLLDTPALDLSSVLCTNGERGLVGVAVHPNFAENHYIYLYYTYNKFANSCPESAIDGPVGRLSRFVLGDNNVVDRASETVLFNTPPMYRDHHTGGDVKVGKDGHIYVTVGDAGAQGLGWPQDLGKLAGKIVRITDTGAIPADNPYQGAGTARCSADGVPPAGSPSGTKCQEVFSAGFRNPFRFAHDPNGTAVRFYVNDVGQHTWEEISAGPVAGGNYGWPAREGPCAKDSDTNCGPAPTGMLDPTHWYHHGVDGGALTAGAFVPSGVWPASYDGAYLFADYVFGQMYMLQGGATRCLTCSPPTSGFTQPVFSPVNQIVSMRFGPYGDTQALYYVSREGSQIRRIAYTGSLNRSPVAAVSATPRTGPVPLTVSFDGSSSSDPDGDALTYAWDFQDDGVTDTTAVAPAFTYTSAGAFTARLTVRDPAGRSNSVTVRIDAGNTPPEPVINAPVDGTQFSVGERFLLNGSATDPEEGPLPDSALSWEVLRHHATHTHPFLDPTPGNDIAITGPEPEDLDAARTSYLEIRLTATDSTGLSATTTRRLDPKVVDVTFRTEPSGLTLQVSGESITTPATVRSWQDFGLQADAINQVDPSGQAWDFRSWSDGGAQSHVIRTPATAATYTATYAEGTTAPPATLTFTSVADTYVSSSEPSRNFGTRSTLRTDASPVIPSYLRFDLSGLGATVTGAKLRIFALSNHKMGFGVNSVSDDSWLETGMSYETRPATGSQIGVSGPLTGNAWVDVPLDNTGLANGLYSVALTPTSNTATSLASRESGATAPQLVLTTQSGASDTTPPSAPTGLTATAVSGTRVDLAWTASEDNVAVTGYEVFRDGVSLATTGTATAYTDVKVTPGQSYTYQVRARDAVPNWSGLSNAAPATTPSAGGTVILTPTDDAAVRLASPDTNYGRASTLEVDYSPVKHTLIRYDLSALAGQPITSAKLRMSVVDSSSTGGDIARAMGTSWSQETVTWNTAPAVDQSTPAVAIGSVTAGTTTEVDVVSLVNGNILTLRISSSSSNGADYSSKEGATAPQLVLTLG